MTVGEILRYWRQKYGYSQSQLAELIHTHQQNISRWEKDINVPSIIECAKLAKALDISLSERFEDLNV